MRLLVLHSVYINYNIHLLFPTIKTCRGSTVGIANGYEIDDLRGWSSIRGRFQNCLISVTG
jgi:hypothetical protein